MKHNNSKHISLVSGAYYYVSLAVMGAIILVIGFWQVESDKTIVNFEEIKVVSNPQNRLFYIPISFCNTDIEEFEIQRYYFNEQENVYYSVPTSTYLVTDEDSQGCFSTLLSANTGSLEPGVYEYRVFVTYSVNPIQKNRRQAAVAQVTVE